MKNVVDYFTGLSFEKVTNQDTTWNDARVNKYGVYIGHIGNENGREIRSMRDELVFLQNQITILNEQFEQLHQTYNSKLDFCMGFFKNDSKVAKLKLDRDELMIDESGHIWIIYADEDRE